LRSALFLGREQQDLCYFTTTALQNSFHSPRHFWQRSGSDPMTTTLAKLLQQKQQLIERLQEEPGPEEREQIERLLAKIDRALDLLDGAGMNGRD
jgi:hypothetical protein